jgi:hypothetical protein
MMADLRIALYVLAGLTCISCTVLLGREYLKTRARLLLWSTLCFICLSVNNVLVFLDLVIYPGQDLRLIRILASLAGMFFLLYGFWEADS